MRVLVTGAYGFIGRHIVQALRARGHSVLAAVREQRLGSGLPGVETVPCDFGKDMDLTVWRNRLQGIDAIVNCAGILRARRDASFDAVHRAVPLAMARVAQNVGARRFIQISVLGEPTDGAFVASKHQADAELLELDLDVTVLRPSLVYALSGSRGGSSLLRALAATPLVLPVPGDGAQPVQPIRADDLAAIVVATLESPHRARGIFNIGGPSVMTLQTYLEGLRSWLGATRGRLLHVPAPMMNVISHFGEWFGSGPLGLSMWRMTQRGSALLPGEAQRQWEAFRIAGQSFDDALRSTPCHTQDRWHARLYPLTPVLRFGLAAVCLVSALAGLRLPPQIIKEFAAPLAVSPSTVLALGYGGSALDAALGVMLLVPSLALTAARGLLLLVLIYTVVLGVGLPSLWLDPFGGLVKNLVLIPAIVVYLVLADQR